MKLKVLFISSGNTKGGISPIIKSQGESLIRQGIQVEFFTVKGRGFWSYFRHIFILKKYLNTNHFDVIHAHYSLTSFVATLAGAKPLVVSLMGSDVRSIRIVRIMTIFFHKLFWNQTIVKSMEMFKFLGLKSVEIIPNGVDIDKFKSLDKKKCQDKLGWVNNKSHVLFAADPNRAEKNYALASVSTKLLEIEHELIIHVLRNVPHEDIPVYMNAADIILLSSLNEGSPNVIKEALACNCPTVSTDVGDVQWLFGNEQGYFLTGFTPEDVADKVRLALDFSKKHGKTNGRKRLIYLGLDAESVANKIINIYNKVIQKQ